MPPLQPSMMDFRQMHERGLAEVQRMLDDRACSEDDAKAAFNNYRDILGIIDSMTPSENESPLEVIDSVGIRRIATTAGTTDQTVIQLLISWSGYVEVIARANFSMRAEGG